jgi:hypothetical protein
VLDGFIRGDGVEISDSAFSKADRRFLGGGVEVTERAGTPSVGVRELADALNCGVFLVPWVGNLMEGSSTDKWCCCCCLLASFI